MRSFWYYRPDQDHPPPLIRRPDQVASAHRLAIAPLEPDLSSSKRRALVQEWCELLPSLEGVRLLWLTSRLPQPLFDAACRVQGLEGLWIKHSGIKSLEAIRDARTLKHFFLGSSTALESIGPLQSCRALSSLGLENIKRISRLDELGFLESLEELTVQGSTWTTQRVDTLRPIGELSELRYLSIINLRASDSTLRPLFALRKLECFHSALWWDPEEIRQLKALNPNLREAMAGENLSGSPDG